MASIWNTALNILARREHSQAEMRTKLSSRYDDSEQEIESVLERLVETGLQSDERFAEMWLRAQLNRGRGQIRIRGEARQKGVEALVDELMLEQDIDWFELALSVGQRKFSTGLNFETKAKAYRFLSYRGFPSDAVKYAIEQLSA